MTADARQAKERMGYLHTESWCGRVSTPIMIVGVTAKKTRIRAISRTKLGGRNRWLEEGETTTVPTSAVTEFKPNPEVR